MSAARPRTTGTFCTLRPPLTARVSSQGVFLKNFASGELPWHPSSPLLSRMDEVDSEAKSSSSLGRVRRRVAFHSRHTAPAARISWPCWRRWKMEDVSFSGRDSHPGASWLSCCSVGWSMVNCELAFPSRFAEGCPQSSESEDTTPRAALEHPPPPAAAQDFKASSSTAWGDRLYFADKSCRRDHVSGEIALMGGSSRVSALFMAVISSCALSRRRQDRRDGKMQPGDYVIAVRSCSEGNKIQPAMLLTRRPRSRLLPVLRISFPKLDSKQATQRTVQRSTHSHSW